MEIEKIGKVYGLTQSTSMITGAVLIWFHAFTGNDYASSIFKRGKQGCFKAMKQCANLSMLSDCLEKIGS